MMKYNTKCRGKYGPEKKKRVVNHPLFDFLFYENNFLGLCFCNTTLCS